MVEACEQPVAVPRGMELRQPSCAASIRAGAAVPSRLLLLSPTLFSLLLLLLLEEQ